MNQTRFLPTSTRQALRILLQMRQTAIKKQSRHRLHLPQRPRLMARFREMGLLLLSMVSSRLRPRQPHHHPPPKRQSLHRHTTKMPPRRPLHPTRGKPPPPTRIPNNQRRQTLLHPRRSRRREPRSLHPPPIHSANIQLLRRLPLLQHQPPIQRPQDRL